MTDQSETMKAVFIEDFGGIEKLKIGRLPTPLPGPGEVQVKIAYTAVNPIDWKIREGKIKERMPHHFPLILGWDAAGVVSALGADVTKFKIGDAVFAYFRKSIAQSGTYAEYICYPAENVVLKPSNLSFAQASAVSLAGLTAWQALFDTANLKKGDRVLIQAGAGGVGSFAIQFAKVAGAFVITTASEANHAYVKRLGADVAIDYHTQSVADEIKKVAPQGLDIVLDTLGGQSLQDSLPLLKSGGRLVSLLQAVDPALAESLQIKTFYIMASPKGKDLQKIADLIQEGKVTPIEIQEMPLDQAGEAQKKNQEGHIQGKIVLKVQDV